MARWPLVEVESLEFGFFNRIKHLVHKQPSLKSRQLSGRFSEKAIMI